MKRLLLSSLKIYKAVLSPLFPPSCRFSPTCSEYAYQAINHYGIYKGCWMASRRLLRCHPFHGGGYDPVE